MGTSTKAGQIDMLVNMQLRKIYIESILSSIKQKKMIYNRLGIYFCDYHFSIQKKIASTLIRLLVFYLDGTMRIALWILEWHKKMF